jgi:acyl-CoA synthetase (AMP-forming)/AMP-acid ligase II
LGIDPRLLDVGPFVWGRRGWLRTGGLGGYFVASSEIEAHIQSFPGIEGWQAMGAVGAEGLTAVAFVTLRPGAAFDVAALRQFCATGLARFKAPVRCVVLDAFPTTASPNGTKVQQRLLAGVTSASVGRPAQAPEA